MKFKEFIKNKAENVKQNIQHTMSSERIQMVELSKLKSDADFKGLFPQEQDKVKRIADDMLVRGFDKSQPIILTKDWSILDGNSRRLAAEIAGIRYVPVIFKEFENKTEALKYELHLQLDRRNLSDSELFNMFQKLEELKNQSKFDKKSLEEFTDSKLAAKLQKSERQVQKMRELSKKAEPEMLEKVSAGAMSINQAYKEVKKIEKPIKRPVIDTSEFVKGVHFALDEIAKGKSPEEILKSL